MPLVFIMVMVCENRHWVFKSQGIDIIEIPRDYGDSAKPRDYCFDSFRLVSKYEHELQVKAFIIFSM